MQRLSGFDAVFIYDESPNEPQHTLKVFVLSPEASAGHSLEAAKAWIAEAIANVPPLRRRALRVPFDLHHPIWIEDSEIDLDHHVRRLALPSPGGHEELCEVISELASVGLDPDRPLWETWFLEGFEGKKVVVLLKLNHAIADGTAVKDLLDLLFARFLEGGPPPRVETSQPKATPRSALVLHHALRDLKQDLTIALPQLFRATLEQRKAQRKAHREDARPRAPRGPLPFLAPRNRFGGPLSRRRIFDFVTVPLAEVKELKASFGTTFNDVLLATVAGAARSYLQARGELPDRPILGTVGVSTRDESHDGTWGNRLSVQFLELPTHLEDPYLRLRMAQEGFAGAKQRAAQQNGVHLENWVDLLPPAVLKASLKALRTVVRLTDTSGGIFVTSVPGPTRPLPTGCGPVENFISIGHMKFVAGLNISAWSYAGKLNFGMYADRKAVPDLPKIAGFLRQAFEELKALAARKRGEDAGAMAG